MSEATRSVAVFGSSEPRPGEPAYDEAYRVGRLLAGAGLRVVNGAYGGVMEASSRGARDAGGVTLGVGCRIFSAREPNPYNAELVLTEDLFERTRELVARSDGFVILRGKAGTLAELAFLWALERAGCLADRPVVLLGAGWNDLLRFLKRAGMLEESQLAASPVVETPEAAVDRFVRRWETG